MVILFTLLFFLVSVSSKTTVTINWPCECTVWAPNDATQGEMTFLGRASSFVYCDANDEGMRDSQGNPRPATYNKWQDPAFYYAKPGVVGCCKWETHGGNGCSYDTQMDCPYGQFTWGEGGWFVSKYQRAYVGGCMTWYEASRILTWVFGGILSVVVIILAYKALAWYRNRNRYGRIH